MQKYKGLLPHLISFIIMAAFAVFYFYPSAIEGKVLTQTDVVQSESIQAELKKYKKSEERSILWTNAVFGGMPAVQLWGAVPSVHNYVVKAVSTVSRLGTALTTPHGLFFAACLGFYVLMIAMGTSWMLALMGGILFGLSTSFIHLIDGGHLNKLLTLCYTAPTLAGAYLIFKRNYLVGALIVAIYSCLQISAGHIQITYYFGLVMFLLAISFGIKQFRSGKGADFVKASLVLIAAGAIGILPNVPKLWGTYQFGEETIRGKSELSEKAGGGDGLGKDYAYSWSLGKLETFSLIAPDFMGATSSEAFVQDRNSESFKVLRAMPQANELASATSKYWGAQPFTTGTFYYGSVLVFLFFVGLFLVNAVIRRWSIAALALIFAIGWGGNFRGFNDILFEYLPLFNKFRAPSMIFALGHIVVAAVAMLGLNELRKEDFDSNRGLKALKIGGGISVALAALVILMSFMMTPEGARDQSLAAFPDLLDAIHKDRLSIMRADGLRSLGFMLAAGALLWAIIKGKLSFNIFLALLCTLALLDVVPVNKRYLPNDSFIKDRAKKQLVSARNVDNQILKDTDPNYRVFDLSVNPFNDALPAKFHKNVGGYFAAKLKIYQELIERYLSNPGQYPQVLNMLNTKYYITGTKGSERVQQNPGALGNAWFVDNINFVENADKELDALATLDPSVAAVVQKRFRDRVSKESFSGAPSDNIKLSKYIPDHLTYDYSSSSDRFAVFSEIYYPEEKGWNIYIDGELYKEKMVKANYVIRGLELPAGKHTLEFKFKPAYFYNGKWIGVLGSVIIFLLAGMVGYTLKNQVKTSGE